jgi:formamidopyrimidine-DNA glycosylase
MPELPEVECFRRMLLPLVSTKEVLHLELVGGNPSRKFVTPEQVEHINQSSLCVQDIKRRGKQICLYLGKANGPPSQYLFVHMGMTGRITTPNKAPQFGHFSNRSEREDEQVYQNSQSEYPPLYTYLTFRVGDVHAAFSDPRKFGSTYLAANDDELHQLAPDALEETFDLTNLCNKPLSVKALLLDQKRVVSGVGNWVADEVLYQTEIHPLQTYLTTEQALSIQRTLPKLLRTAVDCLDQCTNYPGHWLFHFRWTKGKAAGAKDSFGRQLQFLTAGGRTSAIVPAIQKLRKSQGKQEVAIVAARRETKSQLIKPNVSAVKQRRSTKTQRISTKIRVTEKKREQLKVSVRESRRRSPRLNTAAWPLI